MIDTEKYSCVVIYGESLEDCHNQLIKLLNSISSALKDKRDITLLPCIIPTCGCTKEYPNIEVLPKNSDKCEHGNYFIQFVVKEE